MSVISVYAPGHFDMYDSYGLIGCELVRHLSRRGYRVNPIALGRSRHPHQDGEVAALMSLPVRPSWGGILLGYPTLHARHNVMANLGPKIAVTMFESSKIPPSWVEPLNACHAVVVPSTFCLEVFQACGVTAPIYVVPLGVDPVYHVQRDYGLQAWTTHQGVNVPVMTVLAFMDRGKRKGGLTAIHAFYRAFGDSSRYHLVLKGREHKRGNRLVLTNANATLIEKDMTPAQLADLYRRCDVLLNPNRGEGFGLIPREFAATGGVALATGWGGTADDIDEWGWPIPYHLRRAEWDDNKTLRGQDLGQWAEPDVVAAAEMLRRIADNLQEYRRQAQDKSRWVRAFYRWESFAEQVADIWESVQQGVREAA